MNRQIFHGAAVSVLYTLAVVFVAVLQLRLIVQILPTEIAGLWLLFLTVGSYVTFFDLGISPTVGREISFFSAARNLPHPERNRRIGELLTTARRVFRTVAICVGVISVAAGEILILRSGHYRTDPSVCWAWAIFSLGVCLNLLASTALAALFGLGAVAIEKLIRGGPLLIGLALTVTALKLHTGILGLSFAWLLQGLLVLFLGWYELRRRFRQLFADQHSPNWTLAKKLAAPSLKLAAIQLGAILILQSANPVIAIMIGTAAIPPYEALSKLAATMMTLALLIVNSSTPFLSMAYAAGQFHTFRLLLFRNLRMGLGLIAIVAAFVAVNGDRIVAVWLGPGKFAGFAVLWVLLFMVLLEVHHVIFASAAMAAGQILFVWTAISSGVLNIALAVFLSGRFGLLGIALAVAIGQLLTNNWYAPFVTIRFFELSYLKLLREVWLPTIALLATELTVNCLLRQVSWLAATNLAVLAWNCIIAASLAIPLGWTFAVRSSERSQLLGFLRGWSGIRVEQA